MDLIRTGCFLATLFLIFLSYGFLWRYNSEKITKVFTVWLIFSVAIALMPIIFNIMVVTLIVESTLNISTILAKGDFLIVSVAIGSEAIGRIILSGKADKVSRIIPSGICFILVLFSSLLFAYVSKPAEIPVIIENVSTISSVMFLMTMISSGSCVLLAEV